MGDTAGGSGAAPSLPKGGGALQGIGEKFAPDLHTGTGNFTIPLAVPRGRNGFQPQLTLAYSSGSGNGPFGLGWSLSVPGVSRKTSAGVPRYDDAQDTFLLSGAEDLVPVARNGATVRYRPRTEGLFARIERRHGAIDDYWEVRTKDGHVSHYGTPQRAGTDPAAVADPVDRRKVFCWKLSQTTDPFGNRVEYEYERDAGTVGPHRFDQLYLRRIRYADYTADGETRFLASVTFVYEDAERPDPYSEYRAGFEMRTRKRCARIETRTHAGVDRLVRSVRFTYLDQRTDLTLPGPLNGASLLNRITVVGHDGELTEPLPPLEFDYTRFEPHKRKFSAVQGADLPARSLLDRDLALIDLDGNGLPDIIEMNGSVRTWRNLGNGRFDRPRAMTTAPAGLRLAAPGVRLLDADGDGRPDLMVVKPELAGYFPLGFDGAWNQRSFRRYRQAPSFDLADPEVRLLDLTGDGITDALRSGTRLECFFNDAEAGWTSSREVERQAIEAFPNVNFSDPRVRFADMSGDGLTDIVLVHDGSVAYWPSLGHGDWGNRIAMRQSPRFPEGFDPRRILVGDVDGDGLADLIYVDDRRITLWINRSGGAWSPPIEIRGTPRVSDLTAVQLVDLAGSGVAGLLWSSEADGLSRTGMYFLDFTGCTKPYLLDTMDNHMGAVTRVSYAPSTRFYLQDARRRETRWKTTLPFPVQVVARVEVIDQISGGKLTTEYSYHHGYWDGMEREFRGFGRVDQRDTEVFENFHVGDSATGRPFAPVPPKMFSPPLETRTWFHQGPVDDGNGDWEELDCTTEFSPRDPPALARPQASVDLLARLPRRARRDALRTLRGSILRTELYALDGSEREERPYTVTESVYGVREEWVPAPGEDARARIFFPFNSAQRTTQWERGDDPMTRFAFSDDYDQYGQPGSVSSIAVPRGRNYRIAAAPGDPYLATHTATTYANRDDAQRYIVDRVARISSYEIPNDGSSSLSALHAGIADGSASRRLIAQRLEFYDGEAFVGLPFGQIGEHGIVTRMESLAMSEAMLQDAYRSDGVAQASPERPSYLVPDGASWTDEYPQEFRSLLLPLAGYVFQSGDSGSPYERGYFIVTTRRRYDCQDEAAVRPRGLLEGTRDPLGCDTTIAYDDFALLPVEITRASALTRRVSYDYRLLQPHEIVDPNGNRSLATYTPLGLLAATALMGKPGEDVGDTPDSPILRLTYDWLAFIERGQPVSVRTIRRVHHAAETDVPLPRRDDTIETVEYTDGFGRPLQSRTLADDVVFGDPLSGDAGLPASLSAAPADAIGREPLAGSPPRVLVSGWQVYDNKGRVVERYEPFLSIGFAYGTPADVELGQKAILFYDPRGQGIRTVNPDGSEQRVVLGVPSDLTDPERFAPTPWEVYAYDANDNAGRTHADAATAYGHHWNTPASVVLDALGRTVASVTRNGPEADTDWFVTRSSYDIRGNLLTVTDASGRVAFRYAYDFANRALRIESIDAGTRHIVFDAGGNEIERRDGKGALLLRAFDALQRPIRLWARDAAAEDVTLRERAVYGDAADSGLAPDHARAANLLGKFYRHYDEAGLVTFESYDFRGNVLEKVRRVVADAAILSVFEPERADRRVSAFRVNWQPPAGTSPQSHAESLLDATEYRISTAFDALGLLKTLRYPDDVESRRRELRPFHDRAAALVRVELDGATFVERIAYNARGQRTLVAYGNGVMTRYAYDPKTFRPTRLRSERFIRSSSLTYRPSGAPLQDLAYDYDLVGNIMAIHDRAPESGVPNTPLGTEALDRTFAYDPLYRLLSATGRECDAPPPFPWDGAPRGHDLTRTRAYAEGYQYDREGNLTRLRHLADGGGFTRELILAPGSNRLAATSVGDDRLDYGYDANGNLIGETTSRHFEWDHSDRMRVFRIQAGDAAPSLHAHYLYDSTGSRVKKLVRKQSGAVETTVYIDGIFEHQQIREGKAVTENNTLHVKDDERRIALVRVGAPFPDDATPAVKYHLPDHLGSSSVVVDDAGIFVNREEFTPYGQTSFGGFARKRYRFTGKERDEESGLNYHQARYYAPWLGRWTSCDPAGLRGGSNLYAYARANPVRFVDPSGLQPNEEYKSLAQALTNTKLEMTNAARELENAVQNYQRLLNDATTPGDLVQYAYDQLNAADRALGGVQDYADELETAVSSFSQRYPSFSRVLVNDLINDVADINSRGPSNSTVIAAANLLLPGGPPRGRPPFGAPPPPPTSPGGNSGRGGGGSGGGGGSPSSGSSPDAPGSIADDVGGSSLSAPHEEIPPGSKVSSHTPPEGGGTKVHAPKGGSKIVKALDIAGKIAGPLTAGYALYQGDYLGAVRAVCAPLDLALMPIDALLWMQETAKTVPSTPSKAPDYYKEAGWDDSAILMPMGAGGGGGLSHSALQW